MPTPPQNISVEWLCESCGYEMTSSLPPSDAVVAPDCPKCGNSSLSAKRFSTAPALWPLFTRRKDRKDPSS